MFTLEQISDAHDRLGNAATLGAYLRELNSIGVESFTSYLCDGHSEHLRLHSQQKMSYVEMSKGLADSGVEKWTMDTTALTVTYYDKAGNQLLLEKIS